MLKFEIKTKNHMGDKRTYLKYETENVQDVLKAFDKKSFKAEEIKRMLDGKFWFFRMGTGVRITNLTDEIKTIILKQIEA
jgi:hypothetical protein